MRIISILFLGLLSQSAVSDTCTTVHSNAMTASNAVNTCGNSYYRMGGDGTILVNHGICYWPIPQESTSPTTPGMLFRQGWLTSTTPRQPMYLPFQAKDVSPNTGWMYDSTNRHNAIDYSRAGKSFLVHSVADGIVVWAGYMPSPGNVVIIEHTGPNNYKFRTIYHHLRNGRDTDIALAQQTIAHSLKYNFKWDDTTNPKTEYIRQYKKDADWAADVVISGSSTDKAKVDERWGTNTQTIFVKEGQKVRAGHQIAWAGTTGFDTGGIHLHIMFAKAALHRKPEDLKTENRWTFFDPYGLYAGPSNQCYQGEAPSGDPANVGQHRSNYAPVFEDYVGLPIQKFQTTVNYFVAMGWFPRVLTAEAGADSSWKMAGSFAPNPAAPVIRYARTFAQHQSDVNEWIPKGWRPQHVFGLNAADEPRYSTIYAPASGPGWDISHKMTPSFFNQKFQANYNTHTLIDFSIYHDKNNALWLASIWLKQTHQGNAMYFGLTLGEFKQKDAQFKAAGLIPMQVQKYFHPGAGDRYAGLWQRGATGEQVAGPFVDLTANEFRNTRDFYVLLGDYSVRHVSAYKERYSLILKK